MKGGNRSRCYLKKLHAAGLKIPAKASQFVIHLKELVRSGAPLKVVLYLRVSSSSQKRTGSLRASQRRMMREMAALKMEVIAVFREIGSGWQTDLVQRAAAATYAKKHSAILVAESSDRFLRSVYYTKQNQAVLPSLVEWESFAHETQGVAVATLLDPDMPWNQVRSYQTERGIIEKNAKCGRPVIIKPGDKKRRREKLLQRVLWLRFTWNCSYRFIEEETGVPPSTFRCWIKGVRFLKGIKCA